jgi:CRP/FNR family cyclic AMP-dependent transcriptional regulator
MNSWRTLVPVDPPRLTRKTQPSLSKACQQAPYTSYKADGYPCRLSDLGKEAIVAVLEAGQFFGEGCLGRQTHRIATATALDESRISAIPKAAMNEALANEPAFAKFFMEHLLSRNSRIEGDVIDQLFNSSEKRLARLLLLLANCGKGGQPPIAPVTFSQEQLAEMVGTTRSRVSAFMNKFRKLGFIDYNGEIHVHVALLNSVLADKPEIRQAEVEEPA